jgi:pimeloyl-ACP methyl ester carboxylesterase
MPSQHNPATPLVLTVPGLFNSGPGHWQTIWETQRPDTIRVDLGMWDQPHRNTWVNQLNLAIHAAGRPVVLAAHSLGCIAVAWWAMLEPQAASLVRGALLVAPPEVDFFPRDPRVGSFAPVPAQPRPFAPPWWPATMTRGLACTRPGVWRGNGARVSSICPMPGTSMPIQGWAHGPKVSYGWKN